MHCEKEVWVAKDSKDHSWRIAENTWVSGSENLKKNCQTAPTSPHVVWEDFKKNYPGSSKTNSSIFSYQTRLELQMALWSEETKIISFLAANTQDGFGEHRDKSTPCVQWNYCFIFNVVGLADTFSEPSLIIFTKGAKILTMSVYTLY